MAVMDYLWPCRTGNELYLVSAIYGYLSSTNGRLHSIIVADAFRDCPNGLTNVTKCPGFLFGPTIAGSLLASFSGYINQLQLSLGQPWSKEISPFWLCRSL